MLKKSMHVHSLLGKNQTEMIVVVQGGLSKGGRLVLGFLHVEMLEALGPKRTIVSDKNANGCSTINNR